MRHRDFLRVPSPPAPSRTAGETNIRVSFKVSLHCDATNAGHRHDNQRGRIATLARLITDCQGDGCCPALFVPRCFFPRVHFFADSRAKVVKYGGGRGEEEEEEGKKIIETDRTDESAWELARARCHRDV